MVDCYLRNKQIKNKKKTGITNSHKMAHKKSSKHC